MIRDYEPLAIYRKQLALAEDALVSLHECVYSLNPRIYAVFSESYIDMILQLRAEIDEFLKIQPAPADTPRETDTNGAPATETPATQPVSPWSSTTSA